MGGRGEAERNEDEEKTGGILKSVFVGTLQSKMSENTEVDLPNTYSARVCGWFRLRGSRTAKTKKSGTMLKTEISRRQLAFGSDNPFADLNA